MAFYEEIGRWGDATALVTEQGACMTYAALADAADGFGSHLGGRGLGFLLAQNNPESVIGYLGFLRSGTPTALQSAALHPELLAGLLDAYRPHYVWLPRDRAGEVAGGKEVFALGQHVLLATEAPALVPHEDLALLVSTSGSTGSPKWVRQSYRNLASNADAIARYLEIRSIDRPITSLPMSYVFGLSIINSHLLCGASIVLTNRSLAEKGFWDALKEGKATSFSGVPYAFEMLKRLRFGRMNLPSLKVVTQAGGKLNASLVHEFATLCSEKGIKFFVMYGAAEATARMSYLPPDVVIEKPDSIGIAVPGGEFWIEDDNGCTLRRPGEIGELIYRGDNVAQGYATCREDLALGDQWGGVLRTGDLARFDEEGCFYVVGRKRRFIKVFGNRVNLEEIEQHVRKQGIDCACGGEDDRLRVYISDPSRKETVAAFVEQLTRLHRSACDVVVIKEIPRNESGKISYAVLP